MTNDRIVVLKGIVAIASYSIGSKRLAHLGTLGFIGVPNEVVWRDDAGKVMCSSVMNRGNQEVVLVGSQLLTDSHWDVKCLGLIDKAIADGDVSPMPKFRTPDMHILPEMP